MRSRRKLTLMKPNIYFSLVCIFVFMLSACGESINSKYGRQYNSEREKLGIAIIPNDWDASWKDDGVWYNPDSDAIKLKNRTPFHESKVVEVQKNILIYEEDNYIGSEDYHD